MTSLRRNECRSSLMRQLQSLQGDQTPLVIDVCADQNELASRIAEHNLNVSIRERQGRRIRDIRLALERLDGPDYGLCGACGEPIAPARLTADPTAALCVGCQEEQERQTAA